MSIKRIIAFGDSWTFGDELMDPQFDGWPDGGMLDHYDENKQYRLSHCYAGLVANHYGVELHNMAFPGSSLESMRWTLQWLIWVDLSAELPTFSFSTRFFRMRIKDLYTSR